MIKKIKKVAEESNIKEFCIRVLVFLYKNSLRKIMPTSSPVLYAGLPTGLDRKAGDGWIRSLGMKDRPNYERALIAGLREHVRSGDEVVVVGGGWGVTAVVAALAASPNGKVTCFEGSAEGVCRVRATALRNGVAERVNVNHATVGEVFSVYGTTMGSGAAKPTDLPKCDVLELDCEGSEISILRNMTINPRVILVETHGLYGSYSKDVAEILNGLGYSVSNMGVAEPDKEDFCIMNDIKVLVGISENLATGT